jgi:hypothetical protein
MEILLLGLSSGIWFGIFLLAFLVVGIIVSEYDNFAMGTITLITGLSLLQWVFGVPVWAAIVSNPFIIILFAIVYIVCGSFFTGFWKLPTFVNKNKLSIQLAFESWIKNTYPSSSKEEYVDKLKSEEKFEQFLDSPSYPMSASRNKNRLASWVLMWPFALLWELSHKPAIWLWELVYYNLGEVFQQVSKKTARKIRKNGIK